jgi:hypothetical protein
LAGEGKENVVEIGGVHGHAIDRDRSLIEPIEQRLERLNAAVGRDPQRQCIVVARRVA